MGITIAVGAQIGRFDAVAVMADLVRELADEFYKRIASRNPELNAYLTLSQERAYKQADRVDALVAAAKAPVDDKVMHATERLLLDTLACGLGAVDSPAPKATRRWAKRRTSPWGS